jgi:uncharacterized protein YabN with tetrapyrrole methylase and pyrophosphatase domain
VKKFYLRFQFIEKELEKIGKRVEECTLEELDKIWQRSKAQKKI